jgi:hypothetical protein
MIRLVPKSMLNLYLWTYFLILSLYGMGLREWEFPVLESLSWLLHPDLQFAVGGLP